MWVAASAGTLVFEMPAAASGHVLIFSRNMRGEAYFALR